MKKSLFLAALATIALASCTQNEDFSQPEKISFNPVNYKAQSTKAPINTTTYRTNDPSFGVFAFWSETKDWSLTADADLKQYVGSNGSGVMIMFNNQWKSETDYYWPLSGALILEKFGKHPFLVVVQLMFLILNQETIFQMTFSIIFCQMMNFLNIV